MCKCGCLQVLQWNVFTTYLAIGLDFCKFDNPTHQRIYSLIFCTAYCNICCPPVYHLSTTCSSVTLWLCEASLTRGTMLHWAEHIPGIRNMDIDCALQLGWCDVSAFFWIVSTFLIRCSTIFLMMYFTWLFILILPYLTVIYYLKAVLWFTNYLTHKRKQGFGGVRKFFVLYFCRFLDL